MLPWSCVGSQAVHDRAAHPEQLRELSLWRQSFAGAQCAGDDPCLLCIPTPVRRSERATQAPIHRSACRGWTQRQPRLADSWSDRPCDPQGPSEDVFAENSTVENSTKRSIHCSDQTIRLHSMLTRRAGSQCLPDSQPWVVRAASRKGRVLTAGRPERTSREEGPDSIR